MFHIFDGRNEFYQWDKDRKLIIEDSSVKEVHFANCLCSNARVCEVRQEEGVFVVDVPNELLTEYMDIRAWGYDGQATRHEKVFEVVKRTKPSDYVYTPTEVKSYEEFRTDLENCKKDVEELKANPGGVGKPGAANQSEMFNAATEATGDYSHAEGYQTKANGYASHAEGSLTQATGFHSHAEGRGCIASNTTAHAEGWDTQATGMYAHSEGMATVASGDFSHAEGYNTTASGQGAHAEGSATTAGGSYSHAEGRQTQATGGYSHAEGFQTQATGSYSHAEGYASKATGMQAHAEGYMTEALNNNCHTEGKETKATGFHSHAEGRLTEARGECTHVEGTGTIATRSNSHAQGSYNIIDNDKKYLHIVGNGTSDTKRSNAHTLDASGNAWFSGTVEADALILQAIDGSRWKIVIDTAGTFIIQKVSSGVGVELP